MGNVSSPLLAVNVLLSSRETQIDSFCESVACHQLVNFNKQDQWFWYFGLSVEHLPGSVTFNHLTATSEKGLRSSTKVVQGYIIVIISNIHSDLTRVPLKFWSSQLFFIRVLENRMSKIQGCDLGSLNLYSTPEI